MYHLNTMFCISVLSMKCCVRHSLKIFYMLIHGPCVPVVHAHARGPCTFQCLDMPVVHAHTSACTCLWYMNIPVLHGHTRGTWTNPRSMYIYLWGSGLIFRYLHVCHELVQTKRKTVRHQIIKKTYQGRLMLVH